MPEGDTLELIARRLQPLVGGLQAGPRLRELLPEVVQDLAVPLQDVQRRRGRPRPRLFQLGALGAGGLKRAGVPVLAARDARAGGTRRRRSGVVDSADGVAGA